MRFSRCLVARQCSPNTVRLYVSAVRRWLADGGEPGHVDEDRLHRFLHQRRRSCSVATVNLDLKALRAFYRLQRDFEEVSDADLARIPAGRRPPARLPRWLTEAEMAEVLASIDVETFNGLRDYAIVRLIAETGLRASEAATLSVGDLLPDGFVFVASGKGRRQRYVPMTGELAVVMAAYCAARGRARPGKQARLWVTATGRPLRNGRSIWEIVSRRLWAALGKQGGLQGLRSPGRPWSGHYPHELRASFATALLRHGCPITAIAQMLGHADVATTGAYLGVDLEQLRQAASHHPRALRKGVAPRPAD